MSAIAVVFNLDRRPVGKRLLEGVLGRLEHRGTDDSGVWVDGNIGLGHRMRWTTLESHREKLPVKGLGCVLTCDARIDNRDALIAELGISEHSDSSITESEIILAAYAKWGRECPGKLVGDFVFAIWDVVDHTLFCARDQLGVKHFYYFYQPGKVFALASEIKGLRAVPGIDFELNREQVGAYLATDFVDREATFFKNIKRLPATTSLTVSEDGFQIGAYWEPRNAEVQEFKGPSEYQDAFLEIFTQAVASRLRSSKPIGSMLSGGLDSSAIVCVANKYLLSRSQEPIHTFSAVFPEATKKDSRIDEFEFMLSVIDRSQCRPHFADCDDLNPLKDVSEIDWHADQPVGAANIYIDWEIFRKAQSLGIGTMLSGVDGDSTVSHGYEDFARMVKSGRWIRMIQDARSLARNMPRPDHSYRSLLWRNGLAVAVPSIAKVWNGIRHCKLSSIESDSNNFPVKHMLNPSFNRAYKVEEKYALYQHKSRENTPTTLVGHWNSLTDGISAWALESLEVISQRFSMELRFPFFDWELVKFCIALPPGARVYGGWTRSVFRFAMEGLLPAKVQWRTDKSILSAGVKLNSHKFGLEQIKYVLWDQASLIEEFVDIDAARRCFEKFRADPLRSGNAVVALIRLVHLSNWLGLTNFTGIRGQLLAPVEQ